MPGNMTKGVKYGMISVTIWIELSLLEQFRLKTGYKIFFVQKSSLLLVKTKTIPCSDVADNQCFCIFQEQNNLIKEQYVVR